MQPVSTRSAPGASVPLLQHAAGVHERPAVTLQALHDETFAAEQSDASFSWNAMPMLTPFAAARNESFCAMSSPPISPGAPRLILPG
jgi:hypothetical protein